MLRRTLLIRKSPLNETLSYRAGIPARFGACADSVYQALYSAHTNKRAWFEANGIMYQAGPIFAVSFRCVLRYENWAGNEASLSLNNAFGLHVSSASLKGSGYQSSQVVHYYDNK